MSLPPILGDKPRIALAFFGITRSLRLTQGSVRRNLVDPARALGSDVRLFGHFYDQERIENPRSGESGPLDRDEYRLLDLDVVEREPPGDCLALHSFDTLKAAGDPWKDGFISLRNLVHQLHSLRRVTELALDWQPHLVIFARPDLYYHDPVTAYLGLLSEAHRQWTLVPDWAQWRGVNDRFAIAKGDDAIRAYGLRANRLAEYCALGNAVHAERFLKFALADMPVRLFPLRASRVRSNGMVVVEDFEPGRGLRAARAVLPFDAFAKGLPLPALPEPPDEPWLDDHPPITRLFAWPKSVLAAGINVRKGIS